MFTLKRLRIIGVSGFAVAAMIAVLPAATASTGGKAAATLPAPIEVFSSTLRSVPEDIVDTARKDRDYRRNARAWVKVWKAEVKAGRAAGPEDLRKKPREAAIQAFSDMEAELEAQGEAPTPPVERFSGGADPTAPPASTSERAAPGIVPGAEPGPRFTASDVNGSDPNSFPVIGTPGSGKSSWSGMILTYKRELCGMPCDLTDKYTSKVTVNPGARSSSFTSTNTYFPSSGNFENKHFQMWAINRGNLVGDDNTDNLPAKGYNSLESDKLLNGTVLTSALTLWIFSKTRGWVADGAKTRDATCRAAPNNACYYN